MDFRLSLMTSLENFHTFEFFAAITEVFTHRFPRLTTQLLALVLSLIIPGSQCAGCSSPLKMSVVGEISFGLRVTDDVIKALTFIKSWVQMHAILATMYMPFERCSRRKPHDCRDLLAFCKISTPDQGSKHCLRLIVRPLYG